MRVVYMYMCIVIVSVVDLRNARARPGFGILQTLCYDVYY